MIEAVIGSVDAFSADTLQSDDITCLAVRRDRRLCGPRARSASAALV